MELKETAFSKTSFRFPDRPAGWAKTQKIKANAQKTPSEPGAAATSRMATSETRIEIIPIRERERTRATNRRVARKSHNTRESNSVLEAILRSVAVPLEVFLNRSAAQRKARTTANGRIISKNPA